MFDAQPADGDLERESPTREAYVTQTIPAVAPSPSASVHDVSFLLGINSDRAKQKRLPCDPGSGDAAGGSIYTSLGPQKCGVKRH